jgi:hypothetical protein
MRKKARCGCGTCHAMLWHHDADADAHVLDALINVPVEVAIPYCTVLQCAGIALRACVPENDSQKLHHEM